MAWCCLLRLIFCFYYLSHKWLNEKSQEAKEEQVQKKKEVVCKLFPQCQV